MIWRNLLPVKGVNWAGIKRIIFVSPWTMYTSARVLLDCCRWTNPRKCLWNINSASSSRCRFCCINRGFNLHLMRKRIGTNWTSWTTGRNEGGNIREVISKRRKAVLQTGRSLEYFKWKRREHEECSEWRLWSLLMSKPISCYAILLYKVSVCRVDGLLLMWDKLVRRSTGFS